MIFERLSPKTQALLEPAFFIYFPAVLAYLKVLLDEILAFRIPSLSNVRNVAFARFWNAFTAPNPAAEGQPLMGSAALIPPLLASASGTVLDIGPGSGQTIRYFKQSTSITKIYGAEPSEGLHAALSASIHAANLTDKYTIINAQASADSIIHGLQAVGAKVGAETPHGGFDTIVCIRVLCSVPNQKQTIRDLHSLLKPGGRLMVVEHAVNPWRTPKGSTVARFMQAFYMAIGWSYFVGDCSLTRDTGANLVEAVGKSGWSNVQLEKHFGWAPLPYVSGTLTKA